MSNCRITAPGYGQRIVSVPRVMHGINIIPKGQDTTRDARHFYVLKVASSSFSLEVQFLTRRAYNQFGKWLRNYGRHISDPDNGRIPAMVVEIPSIGFLKTGIPTSGITMGRSIGDITKRMSLSFKGASDPVAYQSPFVSTYQRPRRGINTNEHFYPADVQRGGSDDPYGPSPEEVASVSDRMGWPESKVRQIIGGGVR